MNAQRTTSISSSTTAAVVAVTLIKLGGGNNNQMDNQSQTSYADFLAIQTVAPFYSIYNANVRFVVWSKQTGYSFHSHTKLQTKLSKLVHSGFIGMVTGHSRIVFEQLFSCILIPEWLE